MQTLEAYLQNNIIEIDNNFYPDKKVKVLITFIEEDNKDYWLYQLPKNEVSNRMKMLSKNVLQKDRSLFTNI